MHACHTAANIVLTSRGVKDGHGLKLIQRAGIKVGIITGRRSMIVEKRAKELGIEIVYQSYNFV